MISTTACGAQPRICEELAAKDRSVAPDIESVTTVLWPTGEDGSARISTAWPG